MSIFQYHLIIIIISLFFLFKRYKNDQINFFLNYHTYLLIFAIFYFSLPSMVNLSTMTSPVNASENTIILSSKLGFYFHFIFLLGFLATKKLKYYSIKKTYLTKSTHNILFFLALVISIYILVLILINFDYIISIYGDRRSQADFDQILNIKYKIYLFFSYQTIVISFLVLTTKKLKYFLLTLPFIFLSILISDRDFLLKCFLFLILLYSLLEYKIKGRYLVFFPLLLILIGLLRSGTFDTNRFLIQSSGEFLMTWSTTHLIIESNDKMNFFSSLFYSLSKAGFPGLYDNLFGEYKHYHEIITYNNPLIAGLGGSVVAETLSYKNNFITTIMPILVVLYGFVMNKFLRLNLYSTKIFFILSILLIHSVIRFTFLENAFYPIFIIGSFGFWIIFIDIKLLKNNG